MPSRRQGRCVETTPAELNAWLGKESGKTVHVVTQHTDLAAELKRGLSFIHHEKQADKKPPPTVRDEKSDDPCCGWLGDIPSKLLAPRVPSSFRAKGSSHRPNREEYQKS